MAQKSAKLAPRNDGGKDMSNVNLFRIKGNTVQDLEGGKIAKDQE